MKENLYINNNEIIFKRRKVGEISSSCITKSFRIKFEDIQVVFISPRLALDDEVLMITIVDRYKKFHQFSCWEFGTDAIIQFELGLGLKDIRLQEWEKFSWKDHENYITDKVIYPKSLYWQDFFIPPKHFIDKQVVQIIKFLTLKKSISGTINPKVSNYLDNC